MIFYVPDLEDYTNKVGLYVDYKNEMPGPICFSEQEIIDEINKNDFPLEKVVEFKHKYFDYFDGNSTKRVVELIDDLMKK